MRRRACIHCHLIEPVAGQWIRGRCPHCNQLAEHRVRDTGPHGATGDPSPSSDNTDGHETKAPPTPPVRKLIPNPDYVDRPLKHLQSLPAQFPRIWQQVDDLRGRRGKDIPDWPQWCFMPLAGAYAIATQGRDDVQPRGVDVGVIGALAAWRPAQGIYRFDPTLFQALWDTPVEGDLPTAILERLPEWCCYVPIEPARTLLGITARGFFVHLEHDTNTHHRELRFLVDMDPLHLTPVVLHLAGNLSECLHEAMEETRRNARKYGMGTVYNPDGSLSEFQAATPEERERLVDYVTRYTEERGSEIEPLVSLTLYLCSTNAEILGRDGQLKPLNRPRLKHTKRGTRLFPPPAAEVWEVGYRLGATLRAAAPGVSGPDRGGTHATPRPHLRRAHWHAFWTGPKAKPGRENTDRKLVLHWLPPVLVAAGEAGVIPTVHRVTE